MLPLLVLTPQVIDRCALKPMSFLLLSVASMALSYLPPSLFSRFFAPLLYSASRCCRTQDEVFAHTHLSPPELYFMPRPPSSLVFFATLG